MFGINKFISEEAVELHKNYLKNLKLEYSIYEKSYPEIKTMSIPAIKSARYLRYKDEIIRLKVNLECHNLFFSSFGKEFQSSQVIKKAYGSETAFLYDICNEAKQWENGGFLIIGLSGRRIFKYVGRNLEDIFIKATPILSIDLCEHSYFLDYGFNKNAYLENAIKYLNLNKIDIFLSDKD